jgi:hypothetical protein
MTPNRLTPETVLHLLGTVLATQPISDAQQHAVIALMYERLMPPAPPIDPLASVRSWCVRTEAPEGVIKDLEWSATLLSRVPLNPSTPTPPAPDSGRVSGAPMPAALFRHVDGLWYATRDVAMGSTGLTTAEGRGTAPLEAIIAYVDAWHRLQDMARRTVEMT